MDLNPKALLHKAGEHPLVTGAIVFGGGLAVLYLFGFFGSSSSSGSDPTASDYFNAVATQAVSGDQLQMTDLNDKAAVNIAQIQSDAQTASDTTWAGVASHQSDNQLAEGPFAVEQSAIAALGQLASLPANVSQKTSNGFFGIGGGSKTTVTANPVAVKAGQSLQDFLNGLYAHN